MKFDSVERTIVGGKAQTIRLDCVGSVDDYRIFMQDYPKESIVYRTNKARTHFQLIRDAKNRAAVFSALDEHLRA